MTQNRRAKAEEIENGLRAAVREMRPDIEQMPDFDVAIGRLATRLSALFDQWKKTIQEAAAEEFGNQRLGFSLTVDIDFDI